MFDRRALPGTIAGFAGPGVRHRRHRHPGDRPGRGRWRAHRDLRGPGADAAPAGLPVRYKEREDLQEEADKLARENDQMAARAAKFEAEAIAAREQLATAMLAERSQPVGADPSPAATAPTPARDGGDDITDPDTGVFTQVFFDASLGKRISAARRGLRPLTVAMVEVVERVGEPTVAQTAPKPVAEILVETLREADTVARMDAGVFAVLLEDTPENGAIWTLERIRRRISEDLPGRTVRAGMSCYPAYALRRRAAGRPVADRPRRRPRVAPGPHRGHHRQPRRRLTRHGR